MKKDISKTIEIPEGIEVKIDGSKISVKGGDGESTRDFKLKNITLEQKENHLKLISKNATKKEKKMLNTNTAHIKNMIKGANKKFEYTLKVCHLHFPITVEIKGNQVFVKNFLGERVARKAKIADDVKVDVDREIITVTSSNLEAAGQTAANLEKTTWIRARDRRVFQDGIFITNKPGREEK